MIILIHIHECVICLPSAQPYLNVMMLDRIAESGGPPAAAAPVSAAASAKFAAASSADSAVGSGAGSEAELVGSADASAWPAASPLVADSSTAFTEAGADVRAS